MSEGHRSQLKGAPNGQSWYDLSNKINNDSTGFNPQEKKNPLVHTDIKN